MVTVSVTYRVRARTALTPHLFLHLLVFGLLPPPPYFLRLCLPSHFRRSFPHVLRNPSIPAAFLPFCCLSFGSFTTGCFFRYNAAQSPQGAYPPSYPVPFRPLFPPVPPLPPAHSPDSGTLFGLSWFTSTLGRRLSRAKAIVSRCVRAVHSVMAFCAAPETPHSGVPVFILPVLRLEEHTLASPGKRSFARFSQGRESRRRFSTCSAASWDRRVPGRLP